jgi:hypothetical protein
MFSGKHLQARGYESLTAAVAANDQTGSFSAVDFAEGLRSSLRDGRFRLVIVLDSAPDELSRLVGYLGKVAPELVIDLVTVSSYEINGSEVIVPQRVEPGRAEATQVAMPATRASGTPSDTAVSFVAAIARAPEAQREGLQRLAAWAADLETDGLVTLKTYSSPFRQILLPRLRQDDAGLVSVASDGGGQLWLFRSVFERRAPQALARLESAIAPVPVKQRNTLKEVSDEVLGIITEGYREAVRSLKTSGLSPPGPD